jgi:hypothetical protein
MKVLCTPYGIGNCDALCSTRFVAMTSRFEDQSPLPATGPVIQPTEALCPTSTERRFGLRQPPNRFLVDNRTCTSTVLTLGRMQLRPSLSPNSASLSATPWRTKPTHTHTSQAWTSTLFDARTYVDPDCNGSAGMRLEPFDMAGEPTTGALGGFIINIPSGPPGSHPQSPMDSCRLCESNGALCPTLHNFSY